jgi:dipeptidyl-peptidase-4
MLRRLALILIFTSFALAQAPPQLTIEDIAKGSLAGRTPESLKWSPDGTKVSFIQRNDAGERGELWYVDVASGKKAVLVAESKLASLAPPTSKIADERQREWRSRYGVAAYHWSPDSKALLFDSNGQLWFFRLESGVGVQITSSPDPASDPKFSHDGKMLAYIRKHDLWTRKMPDGYERQVTKAADDEDVLNGEVDWVYAEELKVRSNYFWSPDDKQIAYLQMNEHAVPTYPIADYSQQHAKADMQKYPNPGDSNPEVRIGVVDSGGGKTKWIHLPVEKDFYIPRFGWVRPGLLWMQVLNRAQNNLMLCLADTNDGNAKVVLNEKSDVWVNVNDNFHLFKNGDRFLWSSWRDGHTHLYLYSIDPQNPLAEAKLVNQVTKGDFEVSSLDTVDEQKGVTYFTADPNDPRQRQLFSINLDGSGMKQISKQPGTHAATFGSNNNNYVDRYSSLFTPPALSLCNVDGTCSPISDSKTLASYNFEPPQWIDLTAADGKTKLYGMLYMPSKAAAAGHKIPVILHPYGGPSGQSVRDEWGREGGLLHVYLARKGFAVLVVDNRGMANRGRDFNSFLKDKFGAVELADQLAAFDEVVKKYPELDGSRVGIYGGSYGGFMVLYALTHSNRFAAGISISPVSSWRLYDSIYTERYLGLPANNEAGYVSGSPLNDADKLSGALRIAHGTSDDNVHAQNTIQMTQALIKAAKPFELMLYPNKTHGINGYEAINHLYHSIEDHFTRYLKPAGGKAQ